MDIQNLVFGFRAIAHSMNVAILALFSHPVLWGVAIGFALSTAIHAIIVSVSPKHYYHMMTKSPDKAYEIIRGGAEQDGLKLSLEEFRRDHLHIRTLFYLTLLAFFAVLLVAIVQY